MQWARIVMPGGSSWLLFEIVWNQSVALNVRKVLSDSIGVVHAAGWMKRSGT
jgi:hypothetical protein